MSLLYVLTPGDQAINKLHRAPCNDCLIANPAMRSSGSYIKKCLMLTQPAAKGCLTLRASELLSTLQDRIHRMCMHVNDVNGPHLLHAMLSLAGLLTGHCTGE